MVPFFYDRFLTMRAVEIAIRPINATEVYIILFDSLLSSSGTVGVLVLLS